MRLKRFIIALLYAFGAMLEENSAFAQFPQNINRIRLSHHDTSVVIGKQAMQFIEDATGKHSLESVVYNDTLVWQNVLSDKPSFGFTRSVYWFRFAVQYSGSLPIASVGGIAGEASRWLLEIDYPPLDSVSIFMESPMVSVSWSGWQEIQCGDRLPFSSRQMAHRNYVFPLVFQDTLPHYVYVRVATESSLQMPMTLFSRNTFERHNMRFDMFYGALFGTMLTMVAYNLVLFFAMAVPSYLLFVVYMMSSLWYYASISGYAAYLVGDMPYLLNSLTLAMLFCAYSGLALFGRLFLQTFRYFPLMDKVHLGAGILGFIGALGAFVLPYRYMAIAGAALVFVVSILCFVSSVIIIRRGNRSAVYFLIALAAFLIGALTTLLRNLGFIPNTIFTVHSVEIGSAIEGILFSFGLAGQYRWLKKQKEFAQAEALRLQKEANEELERKVHERTKALEASNEEIQRQLEILDEQSREIEIANTTLQEKNLQLEDLNREKNEFLGIAAHDLKNPLSSITMSASIVLSYRDKITEEQLEERLQTILTTSGRMMEIIKNLLDVNAIESGQFAFTVEQIDVSEITREIVSEYRDRASAKSLELLYEDSAHQTQVMGDKTALTEVFENLLSNALKYSPPNKRVFITVANTPMNIIRFSVRDEGPGISEDDKKKLFGKFARLSARPTGGEHSTGLGLSIVKKMVEAMNGRVWCESEFGNGATFIVELPAV